MRSLAMLVLVGLLVAAASAAAAPPPPPKFWTVSRCERMLRAHDYALLTADGHYFHVAQETCVGTGGPHACAWTSGHSSDGHSSRRYSQFSVFTRSRFGGGVVRSWLLVTRRGHGLVPVAHHAGDQYAGWPADFFTSPLSVRLLATKASLARFRSIVAPLAASLAQQENATGCTDG